MKQKLLNLIDAFINGVHSVIKSPYRIIIFALAIIYAKDLFTKAKDGPLEYSIDKLEVLSRVISKMGFDVMLLLVILVALIVVAIVKSKPA